MTLIMLARGSSYPTAKLLAEELGKEMGVKIPARIKPRKGEKILVRYGNSSKYPGFKDTDYNGRELIKLLVNKREFSNLLSVAGFLSPSFHNKNFPVESDYPVLIRNTLTSLKGKGISVAHNGKDFLDFWQPDSYWTKYIPTSSEWRFHVGITPDLTPKIIRVAKKILREEQGDAEIDFPIRTNDDYKFSLKEDLSGIPKMKFEVLSLATLLGVGFYALDVGWSKKKKRPFFFEGNSAPGLDTTGRASYIKFFLELF